MAAVSVQIGGKDAQVSYAGESPGLVSGALQINVTGAGVRAGQQGTPSRWFFKLVD
jgi:uncharacterized protein (TIGR03437 family)